MQNGVKPNIFFIMCDELRSDVFGFKGNRTIKTPHLDQFSQDCAIFHNTFTVSPMCSPARTSLATGKYPLSHGVLDNGLMPVEGEQSIYERLRQYGYRTLNYGKFHCNIAAGKFGFDESYSFPNHGIGPFGVSDKELRKRSVYKKNEGDLPLIIHGVCPLRPEQTSDSLAAEAYSAKLMEISASQTPTFHRLSMLDPHSPYFPTEPYASMYDWREMELPPNARSTLDNKPVLQRFFYKARGFDRLTEEDYQRSLASYYGLVTHVDNRVGKIIEKLKALDLYDQSLIVFTSDHGCMMGEHGYIEKWGHMYEPVSRIPLMIKFPESKFKGNYEAMIEIIDIMPTLLDAAGIPNNTEIHGKSLMPMLLSGTDQHRSEVFSTCFSGGLQTEPAVAVRTRQWKLTQYPGQQFLPDRLPADHFLKFTDLFDHDQVDGELYDLAADPYETNNLFTHEKYTNIKNELLLRLRQWKDQMAPCVDLSDFQDAYRPVGRFQMFQGNTARRLVEGKDNYSLSRLKLIE